MKRSARPTDGERVGETMTGKGLMLALVTIGLSGTQLSPALAESVAEPAGYRMDAYRAPTPETLAGARVVTTEEAEALWREKKAVFFDVMPQTPKPANLPAGTIWRDPVRESIPDSIWLPNVGYGAIPKETEDYFRRALEAHVANEAQAVLFYCMADCWMSWNAAKRAVEWGYTSVIWYPQGVDGWARKNLPLKENKPYRPDHLQ